MATFSAVGVSAELFVPPGRDGSLVISNTFVADVILERQVRGGDWRRVKKYTSTTSETFVFPTPGRYRLRCEAYTSGTVTYTLATAARKLAEYRDNNGTLRWAVDADGAVTGLASLAAGLVALGVEDGLTAHAGGTQAAGLALDATKAFHRVSVCATNADSVLLPPAVVGAMHFIMNSGAATLQVFGAGTDTINDVATATGVAQATGKGALYVCIAAGAWYRALGA